MTSNCWTVYDESFLVSYLEAHNKNILNSDFELRTNYSSIYILPNKEVILLTSSSFVGEERKGILFKDRECFDEMVKNDIFPLENINKTIFEVELQKIDNDLINNISFFQNLLNDSLSLDLKGINEMNLNIYINALQKRNVKEQMSSTEYFAFATLFSEYFRNKINGKWVLLKNYGSINPYYEPVIVNSRNIILDPFYYGFECISNNDIHEIDFFINILMGKNDSVSKYSLETFDLLNKKYLILSK
jgi:hypothetical protein